MDAIDPDNELGPCCAANCFETAGVISTITLKTHPRVGAIEEDELIVLEVPLCVGKHAHLLREPPTLEAFDDRLV